jgi:uncharacterized glyoxalase superfamily protein PhnB
VHITATALSLNVSDPEASARFLVDHFGFAVAMQAEGFVSLDHPEAAPNVVLLALDLPTFKPEHMRGHAADGLLLAFVVDDVDAEHARLVAAGVEVLTAPETEPWGERYAQYRDPSGLVVQLVTWVEQPPAEVVAG